MLCQTAIVYERTLGDTTFTFGHEGWLYERSFVMYDHQTDSLWLHANALCIKGPSQGKQLKFFPSTLTTWTSWKKRFPETGVLGGRRDEGFMGTYTGLDEKEAERFGLGVFFEDRAVLVPFPQLQHSGVLSLELGETPVVLAYAREEGIAQAFVRTVGDEVLEFEVAAGVGDFLMQEVETGSSFDPITGVALDGAWQGERLQALLAHPILTERYRAFYPDGVVLGEEAAETQGESRGRRNRRR